MITDNLNESKWHGAARVMAKKLDVSVVSAFRGIVYASPVVQATLANAVMETVLLRGTLRLWPHSHSILQLPRVLFCSRDEVH